MDYGRRRSGPGPPRRPRQLRDRYLHVFVMDGNTGGRDGATGVGDLILRRLCASASRPRLRRPGGRAHSRSDAAGHPRSIPAPTCHSGGKFFNPLIQRGNLSHFNHEARDLPPWLVSSSIRTISMQDMTQTPKCPGATSSGALVSGRANRPRSCHRAISRRTPPSSCQRRLLQPTAR